MTTSCRARASSDQDLDTRNRRRPPLRPHPATEASAMIVLVEGPADLMRRAVARLAGRRDI